VNVYARHAALNRWMATDKRWNKKVVSRGSVVASIKRLPVCVRNSWALTLMGPSVSRATGKKSWVPMRAVLCCLSCTCSLSFIHLFIYLLYTLYTRYVIHLTVEDLKCGEVTCHCRNVQRSSGGKLVAK